MLISILQIIGVELCGVAVMTGIYWLCDRIAK